MTSPLRDRELELLSAYLDNQLSPADKTQLERRLAAEPELGEVLAGLRATLRALRSLPVVKVPRNFMLEPKVYGRPAARRPSPVTLGWATALATFLFVVVVAGDFISRAQPLYFAAPQPAAAPPQAERANVATPVTETQSGMTAPSEAPVAAAAPATEAPLGLPASLVPSGAAGGGIQATQAPAAEMVAAPTQSAEAGTRAVAADQMETSATPAATGTSTEKSSPENTPPMVPSETPAAVAQVAASEAAPIVTAPSAAVAPLSFRWLRFVEIALAVIALGLGLATFRLRNGDNT
ncbi:MAG: hypothetical protein HY023_01630 [Chloroflexi bacterium]|nr:hypothetical protein [Chloroflexota bacterium]